MEYLNNLYNFDNNYKLELKKINDSKYLFTTYYVDSNNKNSIITDIELQFENITEFNILITESNKYQVYFTYLEKNKIKKYGDYSYQFENLSDTNNFINILSKLLYSKIIFQNLENSDIKLNIDQDHIKILELNELLLLTNCFITNNNIYASRKFKNYDQLVYYYDLRFMKFNEKKLLILFNLEEGSPTSLKILFFDKIILSRDNFSYLFPDVYDINMTIFNGDFNTKLKLSRLSLEDYQKLFNHISLQLDIFN